MILPILRMTASSILIIAQMDLVFRSFTCRITRKRKLTRHWPISMQISNVNTYWVMVVILVLQDFQYIVKVHIIWFSGPIVKFLIINYNYIFLIRKVISFRPCYNKCATYNIFVTCFHEFRIYESMSFFHKNFLVFF